MSTLRATPRMQRLATRAMTLYRFFDDAIDSNHRMPRTAGRRRPMQHDARLISGRH